MARNPEIDSLFTDAVLWRQEAAKLRQIVLKSGLSEEKKWAKPCYAYNGKNICIMQRMKGFLALLFFKGALLKDPDHILEAQGPNSRAGYRMRFTSVQDVERLQDSVKSYIHEAIEVEKAGRRIEKAADLDRPQELIEKFAKDPDFKAAFENLTAGRQRGYVFHFSGAKRSKTRATRIEKCRQRILEGKGLRDR